MTSENPPIYFVMSHTLYDWLQEIDKKYNLQLEQKTMLVDGVIDLFLRALANYELGNFEEVEALIKQILNTLRIDNTDEEDILYNMILQYNEMLQLLVLIGFDRPIILKQSPIFADNNYEGE